MNRHQIGINTVEIKDNNYPKFYYIDAVKSEMPVNGMFGELTVQIMSKDVNLNESIIGTEEELVNFFKEEVWNFIKNFEQIKKPLEIVKLPSNTNLTFAEKIDIFHRNFRINFQKFRSISSTISYGYRTINHVTLTREAYNYLLHTWGFDISKVLEIGMTINNNLPLQKIVFSSIDDNKIAHSNICLVYKKIPITNQTFNIIYDIIVATDKSKESIISFDLPGIIFRKNKINELLQ